MLDKPRGAMTVNEFLVWARIGRTKFYQEVSNGSIVLKKVGTKSVITYDDAEAWLNALPEAL